MKTQTNTKRAIRFPATVQFTAEDIAVTANEASERVTRILAIVMRWQAWLERGSSLPVNPVELQDVRDECARLLLDMENISAHSFDYDPAFQAKVIKLQAKRAP